MDATTLVQDLTVVMIVAAVATLIFTRLRLPPVLGTIAAGVLIGPNLLPVALVADPDSIRTLAELGLVLLLFSIGLELGLPRLRKVGVAPILVAVIQALLLGWLGYELGTLFRWTSMDRLFLGGMLAISSTTVGLHVLRAARERQEPFADIATAVLTVEALLAMLMVAVLSGAATAGALEPLQALEALGRFTVFLVAALVLGLLAVPRLLRWVASLRRDDVLLLTILGLCFGFSLLALKLGYGLALGAFVIGSIVAGAADAPRLELLTRPLRDTFAAVFFVTMGLLVDPAIVVEHAGEIALIAAVVVTGKLLGYSLGVLATGDQVPVAVGVGLSLAHVGELSFVIAALGARYQVTSDWVFPAIVVVSVITSALAPALVRASGRVAAFAERVLPARALEALRVYGQRLGAATPPGRKGIAQRHLRRLGLQLLFNGGILAAAFIGASYAADLKPEWFATGAGERRHTRTLLWLATLLLVLPVFIDSYRKLRVAGMLIAAVSVSEAGEGRTRTVVANSVLLAGAVALGLLTLLLSAPLLPRWHVLVVVVALVAGLAWLLRRSLIRLYTRAEATVEAGLSPRVDTWAALEGMPEGADLVTVTIAAASRASGRRVAELDLRARTGATAIGIERAGAVIINPGPEEQLATGDRVLLLGTAEQLRAARALLEEPPLKDEAGSARAQRPSGGR